MFMRQLKQSHTARVQNIMYSHTSIKRRSLQKETELDIVQALLSCLTDESQLRVSQQNLTVTYFGKVLCFGGEFLGLKFINLVQSVHSVLFTLVKCPFKPYD